MGTAKLIPVLAVIAAFVYSQPAAAAPALCTDHVLSPDTGGITATHLFAKVNGVWIEPQNVCVGISVVNTPLGGGTTRGLFLGVANTVDGGFPETHLPPGTLISLGLHFPPGIQLGQMFGRWHDGVVMSDGTDTVIQAKTVQWDYHGEAYFGGPGLNCKLTPTVWPSTFGSYSSLNPLRADGSPDMTPTPFTGAFYESNTVGALFPQIRFDSDGTPIGLEAVVSGCGDHDPTTLEGYFNGFMPVSVLHGYGMTDQMIEDLDLLQRLFEVYDLSTSSVVNATFTPVHARDMTLEQIPGVEMPAQPNGNALIGVRTESEFSYSTHDLLQRGRPGAVAAIKNCRAKGSTPGVANGQLTCDGVAIRLGLQAKLFAPHVLKRGGTIAISCNNACLVAAAIVFKGKRLASAGSKATTAGRQTLRLKLTAASRQLFTGKRALRGLLTVVVTDNDGGRVVLHRRFR
jgi:energy-converting hydrogenase Eha subunit B